MTPRVIPLSPVLGPTTGTYVPMSHASFGLTNPVSQDRLVTSCHDTLLPSSLRRRSERSPQARGHKDQLNDRHKNHSVLLPFGRNTYSLRLVSVTRKHENRGIPWILNEGMISKVHWGGRFHGFLCPTKFGFSRPLTSFLTVHRKTKYHISCWYLDAT
jgi:hypothetical protein